MIKQRVASYQNQSLFVRMLILFINNYHNTLSVSVNANCKSIESIPKNTFDRHRQCLFGTLNLCEYLFHCWAVLFLHEQSDTIHCAVAKYNKFVLILLLLWTKWVSEARCSTLVLRSIVVSMFRATTRTDTVAAGTMKTKQSRHTGPAHIHVFSSASYACRKFVPSSN